jgi:FKBP-type peptidyl-prolyl cis-trans isomerase
MMKYVFAVAAFALVACGNGSGVMAEIQRAEQAETRAAQEAGARGVEWLAQIRAQQGVEALPSGLLIERRSQGANQSLPRPTVNATVLVHYEGKLATGEVFDSSFERGEPAEFPLGAVVPGFAEAITQMRPGDEIVATFPMELGYGPDGRPPAIPPAAALQFRIILLAFQEPGGQVVQAPQ